MKMKALAASIALSALTFGVASDAEACTGIRLIADNGEPVFGRTQEFGDDMIDFTWKIYPRNYDFRGRTPDGANGHKWSSDYGFVSTVPFDTNGVVEGMNEKGLQVGVFFFQPYKDAAYNEYDAGNAENSLSGWQLGAYLLSKAESIEEVKKLLSEVDIVGSWLYPTHKDWQFVPMIHFAVNDAEGNSVIIEWINGETKIHNNPLGSIANTPRFEWHQENLKRYTKLPIDQAAPFTNAKETESGGLDVGRLESLGGEITSANRFVRASMFSQTADRFADASEGVQSVFNILYTFEIPKGFKQYRHTDGKDYSQYVQWTTVSDLANQKMYIRSYYSPEVKMINLNDINFDVPNVRTFEIPTEFGYSKVEING